VAQGQITDFTRGCVDVLSRSGRIKVLIQPLRHRSLQSEMELELLAIKDAPFGRVRVGLPLLIDSTEFY